MRASVLTKPHYRRRSAPATMPARRPTARIIRLAQEPPRPRALDELVQEVLHRQRTRALRLGQQLILGALPAEAASRAYTELADDCLSNLAPAVLRDLAPIAGMDGGRVAVVGLGKFGSREMTAASDLDLIVVYEADTGADAEALRAFYSRWVQKLVAVLNSAGEDGALYKVDLRLRPYGQAGDSATSLDGTQRYFETEAETWELAALTRARVAWSSCPAFETKVMNTLAVILRQSRDAAACSADLRAMRKLMTASAPPTSLWDCKRQRGGLIDIEFVAQLMQLTHAAQGGPTPGHTGEALRRLREANLIAEDIYAPLIHAWSTQQRVAALLAASLPDGAVPDTQPPAVQMLLACAAGAPDIKALKAQLAAVRGPALAACRAAMA